MTDPNVHLLDILGTLSGCDGFTDSNGEDGFMGHIELTEMW